MTIQKLCIVQLNGIVQEAKELGIMTLDDLEIERMIGEWNA